MHGSSYSLAAFCFVLFFTYSVCIPIVSAAATSLTVAPEVLCPGGLAVLTCNTPVSDPGAQHQWMYNDDTPVSLVSDTSTSADVRIDGLNLTVTFLYSNEDRLVTQLSFVVSEEADGTSFSCSSSPGSTSSVNLQVSNGPECEQGEYVAC